MFDFNKINPFEDKLTADIILSYLKEEQIFEYYFPPFYVGGIFNSPFRKDRNPSFGFYQGQKQIKAKDLATGEIWNCFQFVMKMYGIPFNKALSKIYTDLRINPLSEKLKIQYKPQAKLKKKLKVNIIPFTRNILNYWKQYDFSKEDITYNNAYNFNKYYIKTETIDIIKTITTLDDIRTCLYVKHNDKHYFKLYQPYSDYKWISDIPLDVPFGLDTLPYLSDTLIIAKSWKDMVFLRKYFTDVVATQNESVSSLKLIHDLPYKRKIIFYDNDKTGIAAAAKIKSMYNYDNIISEDPDSKDITDYRVNNGKQDTENFIREIKKQIKYV